MESTTSVLIQHADDVMDRTERLDALSQMEELVDAPFESGEIDPYAYERLLELVAFARQVVEQL